MTIVLDVQAAKKTFGHTCALDGAQLRLHSGEVLALLGPNGAGKTTLVKAVSGRAILDAGSIELLGTPIHTTSQQSNGARAKLGIVPQEIALYDQLTASENLRCFGELQGNSKSELRERIPWALEWTGLQDRANDLVAHYSGGMKRRLNIACSVLHKPEVLILDEPTVGVDPQSRERIWQMLQQLRAEGTSLVLTTHLLNEAQQVCDRITIIDHGKTIATGTLDELANSTVGPAREVRIMLASTLDLISLDGVTVDGNCLASKMDDIGAELGPLVERLHAAGATITDLNVTSPSLQDVFIHLTGRELRD
jgi:ABC-2 type transport system ATP-binding protein